MSSQVVIITGAASGLGAAIALSFAKLNAGLCITDINKEDLYNTCIQCQKLSNDKVVEIVGDVRKDEDLENIVKITLKEFETIDVLINCAGIYETTNLQDSDIIEKFDKIIAINLRSIVALTNKTLPALIKNKGCIINISSVCSTLPFSGCLVYALSKAGVAAFTKNAAFELARFGVRVNCISPGPVKTNILKNEEISDSEIEEKYHEFVENTLLKKIVKAEEIAELAVYLASDKAASITGSDFIVDAGMVLATHVK